MPYVPTLPKKKILIVGENGFLGASLKRNLMQLGHLVTGSSRSDTSEICIDLTKSKFDHRMFDLEFDWVVITAAISNTSQCRDNFELAKFVNVEATLQLSRNFSNRGSKVILFSTDMIFSENIPLIPINYPHSPQNEYGELKSTMEKRFLDEELNGAICRFSKVLGPCSPLLTNWRSRLQNSSEIQAFSDYFFAPISLNFVCNLISEVIQKDAGGLLQCSCPEAISYAEFAKYFSEKLVGSSVLVSDSSYSARFKATPPLRDQLTLDSSRILNDFGIKPDLAKDIASEMVISNRAATSLPEVN